MACSSECAHAVSHYLESCSEFNAEIRQLAMEDSAMSGVSGVMTPLQECDDLINTISEFATSSCGSTYVDAHQAARTNPNALLVPTNLAAEVSSFLYQTQRSLQYWEPSARAISSSSDRCIRTLMNTGSSTGEC
eukprot:SAG31_NODE_24186_length_487_cov_0.801546_1_plen_133_part_10